MHMVQILHKLMKPHYKPTISTFSPRNEALTGSNAISGSLDAL